MQYNISNMTLKTSIPSTIVQSNFGMQHKNYNISIKKT